MKKYILTGTSIAFFALLFTANVNLSSDDSSFQININEQVEAKLKAIDYSLQDTNCPDGGLYKRCEPDDGNECDIHAQTVC